MNTEYYQSALRRVLANQPKLLVAFSGGLDSTVLLHLLSQQNAMATESLRAIHIHHGLSSFAGDWVAHCRALCDTWRVPLQVVHVTLPHNRQGLEAQAREARYAAFSRALLPGEALVTAQHLDDQSETLLLALKRGSGPGGLAAMPEQRQFASGMLLRPLLSFSRHELEQYAQEYQLSWIEDESNQDDNYDRNFLRLRVLPILKQRWPHLSRALARTAQLCGEQEQLLDELLADELTQFTTPEGAILTEPLAKISSVRRQALLRRWFVRQRVALPSRAALLRCWQEVALSRKDATPCIKLGNHELRRYQQALWLLPCQPSPQDEILAWHSPFAPLKLPQGLGLLTTTGRGMAVRTPYNNEMVSVRFRAPGMWHISGRSHRRTLKKLWQEFAIPPWLRGNIPLLFYNEQLITAVGVFVTCEGLPGQQGCWHICWDKSQSNT